MYDWKSFLSSGKEVSNVQKCHHFTFTHDEPGVVYVREHIDSVPVRSVLLSKPVQDAETGYCQHNDTSSMLLRSHFSALEEAINIRCTDNDELEADDSNLKAGLKIAYYYLLKKMAKIVKVKEKNKDHKAAEVDKFTDVLALNHNIIFGDALYKINKTRLTKLRRPEILPREEDCQQATTLCAESQN